ncbi:hypothetical protein PCE1_000209 [Barthelona sp. PCE]
MVRSGKNSEADTLDTQKGPKFEKKKVAMHSYVDSDSEDEFDENTGIVDDLDYLSDSDDEVTEVKSSGKALFQTQSKKNLEVKTMRDYRERVEKAKLQRQAESQKIIKEVEKKKVKKGEDVIPVDNETLGKVMGVRIVSKKPKTSSSAMEFLNAMSSGGVRQHVRKGQRGVKKFF